MTIAAVASGTDEDWERTSKSQTGFAYAGAGSNKLSSLRVQPIVSCEHMNGRCVGSVGRIQSLVEIRAEVGLRFLYCLGMCASEHSFLSLSLSQKGLPPDVTASRLPSHSFLSDSVTQRWRRWWAMRQLSDDTVIDGKSPDSCAMLLRTQE